ncbi:hypothetical protein [Ochrobactrum quorumnocens]|uniref:hypothetical protein n=1 Tax=Ochrobactrum quorumnocens TaxID=271865 RepID=UPI003B9DDABF
MTSSSTERPIPVTELSYTNVQTFDVFHFTGGIVGLVQNRTWNIQPNVFRTAAEVFTITDFFKPEIIAHQLGQLFIGTNQIYTTPSGYTDASWTPNESRTNCDFSQSNIWDHIANAARQANDHEYASLASNISVSLLAAGLQLRNVTLQYNTQLNRAIVEEKTPGLRFTNLAMAELHLSFHSLVAELASTRDYISAAAGNKVGAPDNIDAINRLESWANKPSNIAALSDPVISLLLSNYDKQNTDAWLYHLTEYRNRFLHRKPMSRHDSSNMFLFRLIPTQRGELSEITLPFIPISSTEPIDALQLFAGFYNKICEISDFVSNNAKYAPQIQHVISS